MTRDIGEDYFSDAVKWNCIMRIPFLFTEGSYDRVIWVLLPGKKFRHIRGTNCDAVTEQYWFLHDGLSGLAPVSKSSCEEAFLTSYLC